MGIEDRHRNEQLVHAYNQMMKRVRKTLGKVEQAAAPRVRQAIDAAQEMAVELGELSREEAVKIGDYLRRDMEDAGEYLAGPETQEFADWLRFDIEMIEEQLLDMFLSVADQARLDWEQFHQELQQHSEYHTGQITGPGTLECTACGELVHFHATGHIPPCPKCHGTVYQRVGS